MARILGNTGSDILFGTQKADLILGDGDNGLVAIPSRGIGPPAVNNVITAANGNDTVYAGFGSDVVRGGNGDDAIFGFGPLSTPASDFGGRFGFSNLRNSDGSDGLYGENGNDRIDGGGGRDTVDGGNGDETVIGGGGVDQLIGGRGNDTFVFAWQEDVFPRPDTGSGAGRRDIIEDFQHGSDKIDLTGYRGIGQDGSAMVSWEIQGNSTIVHFSAPMRTGVPGTGEIELVGHLALSGSDFIL